MQDSKENNYIGKIHFSRAFVTSLAVFCGAKLNFDQWYARFTYCHHEAFASCQLDQSVKWIIKMFGQKNILTCTRDKNPFATIGLSLGF